MSMTEVGVQGAKRQSFKRRSPRDLLKQMVEGAAGGHLRKLTKDEEARVRAEHLAAVREDDDLVDAIHEYWFANNYHSLIDPPARRAPAPREEREARVVAMTQKLNAAVERKAKLILMDFPLPNGKALKDATGKECAKLGGWLGAIGSTIKPNQRVGQALSEADVQKLYKEAGR